MIVLLADTSPGAEATASSTAESTPSQSTLAGTLVSASPRFANAAGTTPFSHGKPIRSKRGQSSFGRKKSSHDTTLSGVCLASPSHKVDFPAPVHPERPIMTMCSFTACLCASACTARSVDSPRKSSRRQTPTSPVLRSYKYSYRAKLQFQNSRVGTTVCDLRRYALYAINFFEWECDGRWAGARVFISSQHEPEHHSRHSSCRSPQVKTLLPSTRYKT